ncbi:maleylpyruvate isomerase family mycothiol-dependent enzyme [Granulicoccus phenolivorans]|uniref:maleylpyruvate isomerase family mycothiol-dependent enzyme n=1 Tax=Granulicoccus phenolivorans TaxID=266854 RepID=UPI0004087904|nr:maleylpyruvate isomerase family mycothiol-dependent enzyme [Granulicoccus phenolivorans]
MITFTKRASNVPVPSPAQAEHDSSTEYAALLTMVDALAPADWHRPTDCTAWRVRDLVAHLAGAAEEASRTGVALRHQYAGLSGALRSRGERNWVDFVGDAQIAERADLDESALGADLRHWAERAPAGRRHQPRVMRVMRMPRVAGLRPGATGAYLYDVIYNRDTWLHRIDLHRATGIPLPESGAEAAIIAQVVRDLDLGWRGPSFILELTGRGGGCWAIGAGEPVATVTEDATALMRLLSGRSDECALVTEGDPAPAAGLRTARVVF